MIRIENIYDMAKDSDARRYLIDRTWPKDVVRLIPHKEKSGLAKKVLALIEWRPQLAPSTALWKWFHHDADKIEQFRARYFRELQENKKYWAPIVQEAAKEEVALLYHGMKTSKTPAHFFKEFIENRTKIGQVPGAARKKSVGLSGQGVAVPVEKSISRRFSRPLKEEMSFQPKLNLKFIPAKKGN